MAKESKKKQLVTHRSKTENYLQDGTEELRHYIDAAEEKVITNLGNLHEDIEELRRSVEEKTGIILRLQEQIVAGQKVDEYEKYIKENGMKLVEEIIERKNVLEGLGNFDLIKEYDALRNQLELDGERFL